MLSPRGSRDGEDLPMPPPSLPSPLMLLHPPPPPPRRVPARLLEDSQNISDTVSHGRREIKRVCSEGDKTRWRWFFDVPTPPLSARRLRLNTHTIAQYCTGAQTRVWDPVQGRWINLMGHQTLCDKNLSPLVLSCLNMKLQMDCFLNPSDLFHISDWERAHGKHLETGGPFKKWKVVGKTYFLSHSKIRPDQLLPPVQPDGNRSRLPIGPRGRHKMSLLHGELWCVAVLDWTLAKASR